MKTLTCFAAVLVTVLLSPVASLAAQTLLRIPPKWAYPKYSGPRPGIGQITMALAVADLNGDRTPDVFVGNMGRRMDVDRLLLNDGMGTLKDLSKIFLPSLIPDGTMTVSAGDIDGDGDLDLFLGNDWFFNLSTTAYDQRLLLNIGKGRYKDITKTHFNYRLTPAYRMKQVNDSCFADIDGDGDLDLVLALFNGGNGIEVFANDGKGLFKDVSRKIGIPLNPYGPASVIVQDFTGNGKPDIFWVGLFGVKFGLYQNLGKGTFKDVTKTAFANVPFYPMMGWGSDAGDIDGDGDLDIVVAGIGGALLGTVDSLWINNGKGVFKEEGFRLPNVQDFNMDVVMTDLDLDGDLDLFFGGIIYRFGQKLSYSTVYENDGKGRFKDRSGQWFPKALPDTANAVVAKDMDLDGDPDLVIGSNNGKANNQVYYNFTRQLDAPGKAKIGKPYHLDLYGRANTYGILFFSLQHRWLPLGRLGTLGLDPQQTWAWPAAFPIGITKQVRITLPIPYDQSLVNRTLYTQALHYDPKDPKWLRLGNVMSDKIQ